MGRKSREKRERKERELQKEKDKEREKFGEIILTVHNGVLGARNG